MDFSDIFKRCRLETISEFLISGDSILKEREAESYDRLIEKSEEEIYSVIRSLTDDIKKITSFENALANRDTVLINAYFETGFIAGVKLTREAAGRIKGK